MKKIIPQKIIISFNDKESFNNGIIIYQIQNESGSIDRRINTISIDSIIGIPQINILLKKAIELAKKQEA